MSDKPCEANLMACDVDWNMLVMTLLHNLGRDVINCPEHCEFSP